MRSLSSKNLLITTALALVMTTGVALADPDTPLQNDPVAAAIPLPEPANVPPPTAADIADTLTSSDVTASTSSSDPAPASPAIAPDVPVTANASTAPSIDSLVPVPEPANVPPPTAKDIAADPKPAIAPPAAANNNQTPATAPATTVASADQPIVEKLAEITAKLDRFTDRKPERAAIAAFYKERAYAPLWIEGGIAGERAKAAVARIKNAAADGLDPDDYMTPNLAALDSPQALAEADVRLTVAAMNYARHAQAGRVHPYRVASEVSYPVNTPEPADVLAKLASSKDVTKTLDAFNPQSVQFQSLRKKLAELRGHPEEVPTVRISSGPTLKIGKKPVRDARVPALRERLNVEGDAADTTYDKALAEAVKAFQKQHGLAANGALTPATVAALNGGAHKGREAEIIVSNLERLRWLPRDLGKTYVMVNIPDFTLRVVRDNSLVWQTKIVVGLPNKPTPLLTAEMKFITVNPTWNVPPSIIQNEYLPALRNDPDAMSRIGLKVSYNRDGSVHISQPPGDANALGRIRFNFPNKYLVYQHDTPNKNLFAHDRRAYSHGCMRVENPLKYAEVLLGLQLPKEGYTQERIRRMYGNAEVDIKFPTTLPVHLTYQTAYVDDAGKLIMRDDVYHQDAKLLAALRGDHRVAETSPGEPRREGYKPARLSRNDRDPRGAWQQQQGPLSFFGQLFR